MAETDGEKCDGEVGRTSRRRHARAVAGRVPQARRHHEMRRELTRRGSTGGARDAEACAHRSVSRRATKHAYLSPDSTVSVFAREAPCEASTSDVRTGVGPTLSSILPSELASRRATHSSKETPRPLGRVARAERLARSDATARPRLVEHRRVHGSPRRCQCRTTRTLITSIGRVVWLEAPCLGVRVLGQHASFGSGACSRALHALVCRARNAVLLGMPRLGASRAWDPHAWPPGEAVREAPSLAAPCTGQPCSAPPHGTRVHLSVSRHAADAARDCVRLGRARRDAPDPLRRAESCARMSLAPVDSAARRRSLRRGGDPGRLRSQDRNDFGKHVRAPATADCRARQSRARSGVANARIQDRHFRADVFPNGRVPERTCFRTAVFSNGRVQHAFKDACECAAWFQSPSVRSAPERCGSTARSECSRATWGAQPHGGRGGRHQEVIARTSAGFLRARTCPRGGPMTGRQGRRPVVVTEPERRRRRQSETVPPHRRRSGCTSDVSDSHARRSHP
jgi:hypothetical protein